jgi:oxygen-independent coproporphyrinogen-3 oxidase
VHGPTTRPEADPADLGVYFHYPFCERVCPYCDFAVEPLARSDADRERRWVQGILRELDLVCAAVPLEGRRLATVYFGGGTPSLLAPESVAELLAALGERFAGAAQEVTLELNPGTSEIERIPGFRRAGVTRLSVGVQSFDDETLRRLGRAHRGAEARRGLEAALGAGFASLSADLIYAAPAQSEATLAADLDALISLGVPHVSAYALAIEPGTPFARARERLRLPDEEAAARLAGRVGSTLAAAGYARYEISSFARPGHRSRHNQRYWRRRDVLGLGPSAASLLGSLRTKSVRSRGAWLEALAQGRLAWCEREELAPDAERRETLYLGLRRLEGVRRADYLRRFGEPPERAFGRELAELRALELVCDEAGTLRLTARGLAFADEVARRLV